MKDATTYRNVRNRASASIYGTPPHIVAHRSPDPTSAAKTHNSVKMVQQHEMFGLSYRSQMSIAAKLCLSQENFLPLVVCVSPFSLAPLGISRRNELTAMAE